MRRAGFCSSRILHFRHEAEHDEPVTSGPGEERHEDGVRLLGTADGRHAVVRAPKLDTLEDRRPGGVEQGLLGDDRFGCAGCAVGVDVCDDSTNLVGHVNSFVGRVGHG